MSKSARVNPTPKPYSEARPVGKGQQVIPPNQKPADTPLYSDAKPVNHNAWKSTDSRTLAWQMIQEVEKSILIVKADFDSVSARKAFCERVYNAIDEIEKTTK